MTSVRLKARLTTYHQPELHEPSSEPRPRCFRTACALIVDGTILEQPRTTTAFFIAGTVLSDSTRPRRGPCRCFRHAAACRRSQHPQVRDRKTRAHRGLTAGPSFRRGRGRPLEDVSLPKRTDLSVRHMVRIRPRRGDLRPSPSRSSTLDGPVDRMVSVRVSPWGAAGRARNDHQSG
jgi:hypothetical protein